MLSTCYEARGLRELMRNGEGESGKRRTMVTGVVLAIGYVASSTENPPTCYAVGYGSDRYSTLFMKCRRTLTL